jgi:hypothetical protein
MVGIHQVICVGARACAATVANYKSKVRKTVGFFDLPYSCECQHSKVVLLSACIAIFFYSNVITGHFEKATKTYQLLVSMQSTIIMKNCRCRFRSSLSVLCVSCAETSIEAIMF